MFYEKQPKEEQEAYKKILKQIGLMSNLFSDSLKPALYYRAHENAFCKYFKADNLARHDCSADARKGDVGIGLKTWVGSNNQKVAEFGKLKKELDPLDGLELVKKVSEFRNSRITTTMNTDKLEKIAAYIQFKIHQAEIIDYDQVELCQSLQFIKDRSLAFRFLQFHDQQIG